MERDPFHNSRKTDKIIGWLSLEGLFHGLVIIQQNRSLRKAGFLQDETDEAVEIIDVSEYQPRITPSKQWRECSYDESCIAPNETFRKAIHCLRYGLS